MTLGILAYTAKRAIFDRLTALAATGQPLATIGDGTLVAYGWPFEQARQMCYLGAVHSTADQAVSEYDALLHETDIVAVYVRVMQPGGDIEAADTLVESTARAIIADLKTNPQLAGGLTWTGWTAADGDYVPMPNPEPSVTSALRLQLTVHGFVT